MVWGQVEELFEAVQLQNARLKESAVKQLTVLELKRATAIGIRMAGLKCALFCLFCSFLTAKREDHLFYLSLPPVVFGEKLTTCVH